MNRYLLDTNIISNVVKPEPSATLMAWLESQPDESLYISALTLAEIRRGILAKPAGRKRQALEVWFAGSAGPQALFAGRILPFNESAALAWADLMAEGAASGRPRSPLDMIIAATARVNACVVVTDNIRDFDTVECVNPLR